jgi:hypothetical protein
MPIGMCAGCSRMISISRLPGGNPIARQYPDMYAAEYAKCDRCNKTYCDRCVANAGGKCPGCGKRLEIQGPPPGEPVAMPKEYQDILAKMDRGEFSAPKKSPPAAPASSSGEAGKRATMFKWVAIMVVPAALGGLLLWLTPADGVAHRIGYWALHLSGVALVLILIAPPVGSLISATIGEILRRLMSARALLKVTRLLLLAYVVALLLSPWFGYHARYAWTWPLLAVAYAEAAIIGALLGGIILLAQYTTKLAKFVSGA